MVGAVIVVSTDGSCLRNPGGAIGWAWVNHTGGQAAGGAPSGTNQIAELRAILEAVAAHPGDEPLMIESDSQYAIKCATEWLPGWKRKGWKTAAGSPVKNVELIRAIDAEISGRTGPVRLRWVRGHVGNHFNEEADTLAGEAARKAREAGAVVGDPSAVDPAVLAPAAGGVATSVRRAPKAPAPAPVEDPAPAGSAATMGAGADEPETMTLF